MKRLNRRHFLRTASGLLLAPTVLACGTSAGPTENGQSAASPEGQTSGSLRDRKIGVALVGLGYYSRDLLAPALQLTNFCELRGIVTSTAEKASRWQERYGIPAGNVYTYDNFDRIADNPDIDVVYVVLPTGLHAEYAIRAARAGKHVWCEKPMAMNVAECQSIIDACQEEGVQLSVGYRMQHEPLTQEVMRLASTKPYGAIQGLRAEAGYGGSGQGSGWRFDPAMGGGALYDMGVYSINALRYASGMEPIAVRNVGQHIPDRVDVTTEFELVFPGGLIGYGWTSVVEGRNLLRVDCEQGWYELSPFQKYNNIRGRSSDNRSFPPTVPNQQAVQMDHDALAIREEGPIIVPGREGLRDIAIVNAIQQSARTGAEVRLD
ncbi:MAG: Gfo/Idh/MocA family oxidoreductase [Bacteroidota bacterium]